MNLPVRRFLRDCSGCAGVGVNLQRARYVLSCGSTGCDMAMISRNRPSVCLAISQAGISQMDQSQSGSLANPSALQDVGGHDTMTIIGGTYALSAPGSHFEPALATTFETKQLVLAEVVELADTPS
jgi:hypothetical protein